MSFRIAIATLGCKVNQADSDLLAADFEAAGCQVVPAEQAADAYVVNTCTVTLVADRKARKLVRGIAAPNESALVAVCGCYAAGLGRAVLEAMPEVDIIRGTRDRGELPAAVLLELRRRAALGLLRPLGEASANGQPRVRAMLKVQDGCTQGCAYCIVPSVRGPLASRAPAGVVAEAEQRLAAGVCELVLCGIRLGAYGVDWPGRRGSRFEPLRALVEQLAGLAGLARLRLGSILPLDASPRLFATLAQLPNACPHLHLPLQAGSDRTLRRMGRRYSVARFARVADAAREALGDVALASDVMVGFPGETPADFAQTLAFCERMGFADLHVFAYSPRPGTRAAEWPDDVSPAEKAARAKALADLRDQLWRTYHGRRLGSTAAVLVEAIDPQSGELDGLTPDYLRVRAPAPPALRLGDVVPVRIDALADNAASGQVVVPYG